MKNIVLFASCSIALLGSQVAYGREIQCDKAQKICVTNDTRLHVGDKVGILNEDSELQATGVVTGLKGEKRGLEIEEHFSPISPNSRIVLLADHEKSDLKSAYQVAKAAADYEIGADIGYASVGSGGGLPGQELSLRGGMRLAKKVTFVGRASLLSVQGPVRVFTGESFITPDLKVTGYGILGGVAYQSSPTRPFSLKSEVSLGVMYVNATLGGSAELNQTHVGKTNFRSGYAPAARWAVSGVYSAGSWHFDGGFAVSMVGRAGIRSLVAGVTYDL